jgi:hypothetical protein
MVSNNGCRPSLSKEPHRSYGLGAREMSVFEATVKDDDHMPGVSQSTLNILDQGNQVERICSSSISASSVEFYLRRVDKRDLRPP